MNNKAFTLIELLVVLLILGILMTITIPNIMNAIEVSKETSFERQKKLIEQAAQRWKIDNPEKAKEECIDIQILEENGYLENNLINPKTKQKMSGSVKKDKNSKYIYQDKTCSDD